MDEGAEPATSIDGSGAQQERDHCRVARAIVGRCGDLAETVASARRSTAKRSGKVVRDDDGRPGGGALTHQSHIARTTSRSTSGSPPSPQRGRAGIGRRIPWRIRWGWEGGAAAVNPSGAAPAGRKPTPPRTSVTQCVVGKSGATRKRRLRPTTAHGWLERNATARSVRRDNHPAERSRRRNGVVGPSGTGLSCVR